MGAPVRPDAAAVTEQLLELHQLIDTADRADAILRSSGEPFSPADRRSSLLFKIREGSDLAVLFDQLENDGFAVSVDGRTVTLFFYPDGQTTWSGMRATYPSRTIAVLIALDALKRFRVDPEDLLAERIDDGKALAWYAMTVWEVV